MKHVSRFLAAPVAAGVPALSVPDVKERLVGIGFEIDGSSPEKLAAITKARLEQMQKIIKGAGITIQ